VRGGTVPAANDDTGTEARRHTSTPPCAAATPASHAAENAVGAIFEAFTQVDIDDAAVGGTAPWVDHYRRSFVSSDEMSGND